jgi:hypothetical protein
MHGFGGLLQPAGGRPDDIIPRATPSVSTRSLAQPAPPAAPLSVCAMRTARSSRGSQSELHL